MRFLVISCFVFLVILAGVRLTYGEERSCGKFILTISSELTKKFDPLKLYKKADDWTEMYRDQREHTANSNDGVAGLKRLVAKVKTALMLSARLKGRDLDLKPDEKFFIATMELVIKDTKDKSSELVLLCFGRMRFSDGVRHFMLSVIEDEDEDRFWRARLL